MNKNGKNFKIFGVRHGIAGDLCFALPVLNYLELKYPNSYKYWLISKKCSQFAPLFLNHKLIDCIRITGEYETLNSDDKQLANSCDLIINTEPQCPDGMPGTTEKSCWWNYYNCYEMAFRMAGFDVKEYREMPKELQFPVLNQWFDVKKQDKTIGIWGFTSYGKDSTRSPSVNWWIDLVRMILKETDYTIYQFGGEKEPDINPIDNINASRIVRHNNLPILDQYKLALGCNLNINTNSGSGIILGAYGAKQITLLTNDAPNHYKNPLAFAPLNYKDNNFNIFTANGFNNLDKDIILNEINKLC